MPESVADPRPLLSIVATSRNDDHGSDLLRRMQIFVDGLIAQCRRFDLDCELILVEWNPPPDRPRLIEALRWPDETGSCKVRIIEVPPAVHARFAHADGLPLFQMIGKNVGIRRARGRFILATNIDILFSDALMAFFAKQDLSPDVMYRIDRHDVDENVPVGRPISEVLAYCESNVLRINRRAGTLSLTDGTFDRIYWPRPLVLFVKFAGVLRPLGYPLLLPYLVIPAIRRRMRRRRPPFAGLRRFARLQRRRTLVNPHQRRPPIPWVFVLILGKTLRAVGKRIGQRTVTAWRDTLFEFRRGRLHTNACGDFTLMARDAWDRLRGYPEFEMYSFHIDSLFCHAAVAAGYREQVIREPARIYHVEHAAGSGFTPENQRVLWTRMKQSGVPRLGDAEFWSLVVDLRHKRKLHSFNAADWGLDSLDLPEYDIPAHCSRNSAVETGLLSVQKEKMQ